MKVLITGATGRVGSRLAQALVDRGEQVRTLVLPDDPGAARARDVGIECVTGSITNMEDTLIAAQDVDVVFHLAALILFQQQDRPILWDVNVQGTYHVFESAVMRANRPLRLIFSASDQVYSAARPLYTPTDETHPLLPGSFYGMSKVLGEDMVRFYARSEKDVDFSIARFTHTEAPEEFLDPNGFFSRRLFYVNGRLNYLKESRSQDPKVLDMIRILEPLAAPDEPLLLPYDCHGKPFYQELTDVRDIVQGLLLILDRPEAVGEAFNLTPPSLVNFAEFIPYMARLTGRRYVEARLPIEAPKCHASSAKARTLLGYAPQYTMFDMIDQAVKHHKS